MLPGLAKGITIMAFTKLSDKVRHPNNKVYTLGELLDLKMAYVRKVDHFHSRRAKNGTVTAYFVDIIVNGELTTSGWRIGQKAYESRKAKGQ